jgi:polysaccharide biosynthesis/export protein ExoF
MFEHRMNQRRVRLMVVLLAFGVGLGQSAAADETVSQQSAKTETSTTVMTGDRLHVAFFEQLDLRSDTGTQSTDASPVLKTFYQRVDLTADYLVDADGRLTIPHLHQILAAGRKIGDIKGEIAADYVQEVGRATDVSLSIVERQPVYVVGLVRKPGSYLYAPGMIALQAISLAGGINQLSASQLIDSRRERERYDESIDRLEHLLAHEARLKAEAENKNEIAPPTGLYSLVKSAEKANELMTSETRVLRARLAARAQDAKFQDAIIQSATGELAVLKASVDSVDQEITARQELLSRYQGMKTSGFINNEIFSTARKDVTDYQLRRQQLVAAISAAQQRISQAEAAKGKIDEDDKAEAARDLMRTDDEIAPLIQIIAASRDLLMAAEADGVKPGAPTTITIIRRNSEQVGTIQAQESTGLLPGDVVKVEASPATDSGSSKKAE